MPIFIAFLEFTAFPCHDLDPFFAHFVMSIPFDTPELFAFLPSLQGTAGSALPAAQQPDCRPSLSVFLSHAPASFRRGRRIIHTYKPISILLPQRLSYFHPEKGQVTSPPVVPHRTRWT